MVKYDVIVIGGGIAGIFAAYELSKQKPDLKVAILEKGNNIYDRECPVISKKIEKCVACKPCAIMEGFGGCGSFSDGKYNFTTEFGGWLHDYIGKEETMRLINYVDSVLVGFGATKKRFSTYTEEAQQIYKLALQNDLHLLQAEVKHLGTENNLNIMKAMYNYLKDRVEIRCNEEVTNIEKINDEFTVELKNGTAKSKYLVLAVGRAGSEWFSDQCKKLGLNMINNQVDLGVRVELPYKVFQHITDKIYEFKIKYRTKQFGDIVRSFCVNPKGHVVTENRSGILTVNGHSYADPLLQSENTNFALLVSNKFTLPFANPYKYGNHIASLSNMLGGGVLVQRFGDLIKGRRTNEHRLSQSFVRPTLNATPGDLSLVLPKRHMDNIIEMIYALDKIAPGSANYDTLLYGIEVKFYSAKPELNNQLETNIQGLYACGDGAGITRSLSFASSSAVHVANCLLERF